MTPERWRQVTEVFHAALARDAAAREALLDEACAGDAVLRSEVDALLAAHKDAGGFGEEPLPLTQALIAPRLRRGDPLGPYRIETLIGSGGMGEVYRARDTRLDRDVAIKVLALPVAGDGSLKHRLAREAKALATLSHPHICPVFDVGEQEGVDYLVMEYLEGETLAMRLTRGALPLGEALRCAVQVADALDKAHGQGIVHRDLKPGNVMLTRGGAKLLDFGIAKVRTAALDAAGGGAGGIAPLTLQGTVLGTLQYMAPEQLSGEAADARTDIFAFGSVLYEMVTGRKAFEGTSKAHVMAAILEHEPTAVSQLQPTSPPALDHLIRTCLAKDPDQRWQSAGDLARDLAWLMEARTGSGQGPQGRKPAHTAVAVAAGLSVLIAVAAFMLLRPARPPEARRVNRFDHHVPPQHELRNIQAPVLAVAPDGTQFVYNTTQGLYLRSFREAEARPMPGTEEDLVHPFFSPDGRWIGYFAGGELKKIAITGGVPISLCKAGRPFGVHWGDDGAIVFGQADGIMRIPSSGGAPVKLLATAEGEAVYGPQVLPGGKWLLLTVAPIKSSATLPLALPRWDEARIVAQSLESTIRKTLWTGGTDARYLPSGHLLFVTGDTLSAMAFDADKLEASGGPVALVNGLQRAVAAPPIGAANYGVSDDGTLVFVRSWGVTRERVLALVDRLGGRERLEVPPGPYSAPRVSPDGRRIAFQTLDQRNWDKWTGQIWIYDLDGKHQVRQLTTEGNNFDPVWTPDSERVTFSSDRKETRGADSIFWQPLDGGPAERLTTADEGTWHLPTSWSRVGPTLAFEINRVAKQDTDIWTLARGNGKEPHVFQGLPGLQEAMAAFSPDGRWVAYASNETGRDEIYIQPFPPTGAKIRVTQDGGAFPLWSPDGRELFYRRSLSVGSYGWAGAQLFRVPIATQPAIALGAERALPIEGFLVFSTFRDFDITPDGKRFVMVYPAKGRLDPMRIAIVQNWVEELKTRVPSP